MVEIDKEHAFEGPGGTAALLPCYWSYASEFNYDFHVTVGEGIAAFEYSYRSLPARR